MEQFCQGIRINFFAVILQKFRWKMNIALRNNHGSPNWPIELCFQLEKCADSWYFKIFNYDYRNKTLSSIVFVNNLASEIRNNCPVFWCDPIFFFQILLRWKKFVPHFTFGMRDLPLSPADLRTVNWDGLFPALLKFGACWVSVTKDVFLMSKTQGPGTSLKRMYIK